MTLGTTDHFSVLAELLHVPFIIYLYTLLVVLLSQTLFFGSNVSLYSTIEKKALCSFSFACVCCCHLLQTYVLTLHVRHAHHHRRNLSQSANANQSINYFGILSSDLQMSQRARRYLRVAPSTYHSRGSNNTKPPTNCNTADVSRQRLLHTSYQTTTKQQQTT